MDRPRTRHTTIAGSGGPYVNRLPGPDRGLAAEASDLLEEIADLPTYRPTVGCVIPAYNEGDSLASVLDSLLMQTRLPDTIHVVVNNTTDDTIDVASHFAGVHTRETHDDIQVTEIYVHDIGENPDKKVGALNYGYALIEGSDYLLGVDGDTTADPRAVEYLVDEMQHDDRIGGISAIYSIDDTALSGPVAKWLIAGQRAQFAAFNMQNLLRGRSMAVLGGQFSIFRVAALQNVMDQNHQRSPWVRDSEVEDSLLSLQIKNAGYLTKISAQARAHVGGMTTLRALDAQQVKWNLGAIELMWPGQRGDTKGQPFHPNLRLRWFEHLSMLTNATTRFLFFALLFASLSISAWVPLLIWLIPPIVATILNYRVARSMKDCNGRDRLFALTFIGAELYMWIRLGHFARAWAKFARRGQQDSWAAQAKAEGGSGNAYLVPHLLVVLALGAFLAIWFQLPAEAQSLVLYVGWPLLGAVTVVQTTWMLLKVFRNHKGYQV